MTYVSEYCGLLVKQYWEKTNAKAEIALKSGTWENIFNWLKAFETEFDLDIADSDRLNIIGRIVGVTRNVPSILKKVFFGFDDNPDVTGFDDKFIQVGDLGAFYSKFSPEYSSYQLNDDDFRFFIKAKITKNIAHGIMASDYYENIQSAIITLFDGMAFIEDNFDMSMTLHISYLMNEDRTRIIFELDLLPKTQSVKFILVQSEIKDTFGFDDNTNSKGFKNKFDSVTEPGGKFLKKLI